MAIHPQEASHRSSRIATDLAVTLAIHIDSYSQFISKDEMFHIQMQMLYVLIDLLGATHGSDPEHVIEHCKGYFKTLRREINATDI